MEVSRGGVGVGPSTGHLVPPPPADRSVQEELCVCAFAGPHLPWLPLSHLWALWPLQFPFSELTTEAGHGPQEVPEEMLCCGPAGK